MLHADLWALCLRFLLFLALVCLVFGSRGILGYGEVAIAAMGSSNGKISSKKDGDIFEKWSKWLHNYGYDKTSLERSLKEFTKTPHPFGSKRQKELSHWLALELKKMGVFHAVQSFQYDTPNYHVLQSFFKMSPHSPDLAKRLVKHKQSLRTRREGYNVVGKITGNLSCSIILGSHYDSKELYEEINVGANDSGSSSAALLEMVKVLQAARLDKTLGSRGLCDIYFVWFDGEESVLKDWNDGKRYLAVQDNTYGSRYMASHIKRMSTRNGEALVFSQNVDIHAKPLVAVVVVDMVGTQKLKLTRDGHSTAELQEYLKIALRSLSLSHLLANEVKYIEDDHMPFLKRGIPSLLLINFEDLRHWHTPNDTMKHINLQSIIEAMKVASHVLLQISFAQG